MACWRVVWRGGGCGPGVAECGGVGVGDPGEERLARLAESGYGGAGLQPVDRAHRHLPSAIADIHGELSPLPRNMAGMEPETVSALSGLAAAIAAFVAAGIALIALFYTARAANAAKAQTELQREMRKDAAQPYVWADVRADQHQGTLLNLVLGNAGPTFAHNVRATFEPSLPTESQFNGARVQERLRNGVASLGPGHRLVWPLGRGFELLSEDAPQIHTVTIDADGPFGPMPTMVYQLNLADLRETHDVPEGSLHLVRKAIQDVAKAVTDKKH